MYSARNQLLRREGAGAIWFCAHETSKNSEEIEEPAARPAIHGVAAARSQGDAASAILNLERTWLVRTHFSDLSIIPKDDSLTSVLFIPSYFQTQCCSANWAGVALILIATR